MKRIGINGFGRIGRYFTRMVLEREGMQLVAINDLTDAKTLAHLLKYDTVHGKLRHEIRVEGNIIHVGKHQIQITAHRNPEEIPWKALGVDYVLESTGIFRTQEAASKHFVGGAKKVILSAPSQGEGIKTVVLGVNDSILTNADVLVSNASCTTNSAAPLIKVMETLCHIESAYITTVHSYTSDQRLQDSPHSDLRRARAAAESIIPTTTGAAKALSLIFPELDNRIGGCGIRVPVKDGSLTDLTLVVDRTLTVTEINNAFLKASQTDLKGILEYTEDPIVSVDVIGNPHSSVFDADLTSIIGERMVKVVAWYDNEAGYSNRLVDLIERIA